MEDVKENNSKQWVSVSEIQKEYLPLSKKKIRELICKNLDVVKAGNKMIVERKQLEAFLRNEL
ncbi:MAG: helix-turn-helix domain-containing protein [Lachnospiraceae bacterium]|nr:helix-turn-helix domain-containing protein [Lachnospiraceae bacterium]